MSSISSNYPDTPPNSVNNNRISIDGNEYDHVDQICIDRMKRVMDLLRFRGKSFDMETSCSENDTSVSIDTDKDVGINDK